MLKDNPNLFYHPQRKKMLKALAAKNELNQMNDIDGSSSFGTSGSQSPTFFSPPIKTSID